MKNKLFAAALLFVSAAAADDTPAAAVPWGASESSGLSVLVLPQFGPPAAIAGEGEPPAKAQGVMLTISSDRVKEAAQAGARIRFKVYLTAVLQDGKYAFTYSEIEYSPKYPTTLFVACGLTAKVATLRIEEEQTRRHDVGQPAQN